MLFLFILFYCILILVRLKKVPADIDGLSLLRAQRHSVVEVVNSMTQSRDTIRNSHHSIDRHQKKFVPNMIFESHKIYK